MEEDLGRIKELERRIRSLEDKSTLSQQSIITEQYKIVFSVITSLNDNVVKSILSMFVVYFASVAFVVQGYHDTPKLKYVIFLDYALIFVYFYYLGYLRFRITTLFKIIEEIETKEKFKYRGMRNYEKRTDFRFFSTKGLFVVIMLSLILINTVLIFIL